MEVLRPPARSPLLLHFGGVELGRDAASILQVVNQILASYLRLSRFGLFSSPSDMVRDVVFAKLLLKSFGVYWDLCLPDATPEPIYAE